MTVRPWHLLLPVVLLVSVFNWGFALLLWLTGWFFAYIFFGGLRRPIFRDYGVEPSPRFRNDDTTDGSGAA